MTAAVRITAREQVGERIHLYTVESETFDDCIAKLQKQRAEKVRAKPDGSGVDLDCVPQTTGTT